jgi:hypothetical protein
MDECRAISPAVILNQEPAQQVAPSGGVRRSNFEAQAIYQVFLTGFVMFSLHERGFMTRNSNVRA